MGRQEYILGTGVKRHGVFVEESKKLVKNGCFGRMHEGRARLLLGGEDDGNERGNVGEERGEAVASIKAEESLSAICSELFCH